MKVKHLLVLIGLGFALSRGVATTVIPPTFTELVQQAEVIFQGTVTKVQSIWSGEGALRHIDTYVSFQVEDSIKGSADSSYTIRMLGGTVGDETMEVTDTPKFEVGDRDILFVEHNEQQFVPLVGIMHGRFRVESDQVNGREFVTTGEGRPLRDLSKLGREEEMLSPEEAISPAQFKSEIRAELSRNSR
jgi:hypothetical protein